MSKNAPGPSYQRKVLERWLAAAEVVELQLPVIHLNGNSKESLIMELLSASEALRLAVAALQRAGSDLVNLRNYYPLRDSDAAWKRATEQQAQRLAKLEDVNRELQKLVEGIDAGGACRQ